jgi:hypothetical protein
MQELGTVLFSVKNEVKINNCKQKILHHRIILAVQTVEFPSDRGTYTVLRGLWITSLFWIRMHQLRRIATIKATVLWGIREGLQSLF